MKIKSLKKLSYPIGQLGLLELTRIERIRSEPDDTLQPFQKVKSI